MTLRDAFKTALALAVYAAMSRALPVGGGDEKQAVFPVLLLIVQLALFVASALLQKGPKYENARAKTLGEFQFPTATEDRAVPVLWGTADIKGPNVLWSGDLKSIRIIEKVSGGMFRSKKKITVGYRYKVGMDLLLCYGPIDRITRLEINDSKIAFTGSINMAAAADTGHVLNINKPNLLGGKTKGGGVIGNFRIYKGSPTQQKSSYLITKAAGGNPALQPAYVDIAHVVAEQVEVGESENIGNYVFRATRFPNNLALGSNRHIVNGTIDDGDANPAECLYEILTAAIWGIQLDPGLLNLAEFQAAGITLFNEGMGMSRLVSSQALGTDLANDILRLVDGALYEQSDGSFRFRLIRDDYVLGSLPTLDDTSVIRLESFSRASWDQTINHFSAAYTDRAKDFQDTSAMAQDLANFRTQGVEVRVDNQFPGLAHKTPARKVAERELRQQSFPFAKVKLVVNRKAQSLRPGDVFKWSNAQLGITDLVLRVMTVDLGDVLNGQVVLNCVQDIFRLSQTIFADPIATQWTAPSNDAVAFTVERVRSTPRIYLNLNYDTTGEGDPTLGERVQSFAARTAPQVNQFEQFVDAGAGYLSAGDSLGLTPTGLLSVGLSKLTSDIHAAGLTFNSALDADELTAATAGEIGSGLNLALIEGATEGEDEIVGWESITDNLDGSFTLGNVHRGLMDTQARTHSIGARIWFFSDGQSITDLTYADTAAVNVKHQSETTASQLDIATATARALTFSSRLKRPHHPARFRLNTTRLPLVTGATADFAFDWLHRLNADVPILDAGVGSTGSQDTEVEYDLVLLHGVTGATLRTEVRNSALGAGWLAYTWTAATAQGDTGEAGPGFPLRATLRARYAAGATVNPANMTSLQTLDFGPFPVDLGGAVVRSIDFDGLTEHVANTSNNTQGIANNFTFEGWFRPTGSGGALRKMIMWRNTGGNANRIDLELPADTAAAPFRVRLWNSAGTLFKDYTFGAYTVNAWTCLGFTWNGTNLIVYQNGVDVTAGATKTVDTAGTMTDTGRAIIVGVDETVLLDRYVGLMYRLALWNTARSAASMTATYNSGNGNGFDVRTDSGNYAQRAALVHMWDWRIAANIGADFGFGTKIDIDTNALLMDSSDHNVDVP